MKNSLFILGFFSLGVISGTALNSPDIERVNELTTWALYVLMFAVGLVFGSDKNLASIFSTTRISILLLPLLTICGTFVAAMLYILLFSTEDPRDVMAVASGFGYYSLSSILIAEFSAREIATIALLSNVARELITLITAPLIYRFFGPLAVICSAGATSMDTCLPVILKNSGKEYMIPSLVHGLVLTILVPFFISFIYKVF